MQKCSRKRIGSVWIAVMIFGILTSGMVMPVSAQADLVLASETAVMLDAQTGQVLYEKDSHKKMYPASITKIMTGLLAMTHLKPQDVLTVSECAVNAVPRTSSHIGLEPGEEMTVENLMYAIALQSANDAANVLAEGVGESLEGFAQLMTDTAAQLGATDTHFTNANGLPDQQHYTTAYDMALITAEALKLPELRHYFSTTNYDCPQTNLYRAVRNFENKNQMLPGAPYYYEGVLMSKTGWTSSALGTLVTAVKRDDRTLIVVVMKSEILESKYQDTWTLLDYGFSNFYKTEVAAEKIVGQLSVGEYQPVPDQKFVLFLPVGTDLNDIEFKMENDPEVLRKEEQMTVLVTPFVNGEPYPQIELELIYQIPEQVEDVAEIPIPRVTKNWLPETVFVIFVLVLLSSAFFIRISNQRRHRRNRLEGRIRRMKKQMENREIYEFDGDIGD